MRKISPLPGFVICEPYVPDQTFSSIKEEVGESQKSKVIAVGDEYLDDHGNKRVCPVSVGDVIIHRYAQETFDVDHLPYRAVPYYQIIAKLSEVVTKKDESDVDDK